MLTCGHQEKQFRKLNAKKENKDVKVMRGGNIHSVSVYDISVGDVAIVETGDILPADGVLINGKTALFPTFSAHTALFLGHGILVDESAATGESDNIQKSEETDPFFLSGTQVVEGYGTFLVIAVGAHSMHGKVNLFLSHFSPILSHFSSF